LLNACQINYFIEDRVISEFAAILDHEKEKGCCIFCLHDFPECMLIILLLFHGGASVFFAVAKNLSVSND